MRPLINLSSPNSMDLAEPRCQVNLPFQRPHTPTHTLIRIQKFPHNKVDTTVATAAHVHVHVYVHVHGATCINSLLPPIHCHNSD